MTIQATKKLQEFIGIKSTEVPADTDSPNLWHGNLFMIGRKKCLLLVHNRSYYSIFLYGITKKELKHLPSIIKQTLTELLRCDNFTLPQIVNFTQSAEEISYAKTSDRKVIGVMNNMM